MIVEIMKKDNGTDIQPNTANVIKTGFKKQGILLKNKTEIMRKRKP